MTYHSALGIASLAGLAMVASMSASVESEMQPRPRPKRRYPKIVRYPVVYKTFCGPVAPASRQHKRQMQRTADAAVARIKT